MGEAITVPEFCPGGHKRNPGEVHLSSSMPGMWMLSMDYGCDQCEIEVFTQLIMGDPPSEVRDTGGNVLRIVT